MQPFSPFFLLSAGLLLLALFLLFIARILARRSGIPAGRIIYSDHGQWQRASKPLYDAEVGLTGKPDYLIQKDGKLIPAEVKSSYAPRAPYDSHIMQLAAYCVLVEREFGERPPYGLLRYRNRTFEIPFTPQLESQVLDLISAIRRLKEHEDIPRSHNSKARCARCGYRNTCDQRL
jgi:CRISPR-associated exonuclease Cas4